MKHCTQCGHVLGLGRFCTNCGHPVAARNADPLSDPVDLTTVPGATEREQPDQPEQAWRTDTAERAPRPSVASGGAVAPVAPVAPTAAAAPRVPPTAVEPPPPPRFPLFADEVDSAVAGTSPTSPELASEPVPATVSGWAGEVTDADDDYDDEYDDEDWDDWEEGRRPRAVWVVASLVVLAALVAGAWFLGQALGDDSTDDPTAGLSGPGQEPVDHTAEASAVAPETAPSTQDVEGDPTSYDASNMLDGVPETAWRAAGDGSGLKLVFTFADRTRISEVGLINGYAKTATNDAGKTFDWYAGHRRITQVTWNFGVGAIVRQELEDGRAMQTIDVGPVETRKLVLKIVATTPPGQGPARRDFTAISDVFLAG